MFIRRLTRFYLRIRTPNNNLFSRKILNRTFSSEREMTRVEIAAAAVFFSR